MGVREKINKKSDNSIDTFNKKKIKDNSNK